jgi:hypothetical protein
MVIIMTHQPCGAGACGEVGKELAVRCTELRSFTRCSCFGTNKKFPTRGRDGCSRCNGVGYFISGTRPGCGGIASMCKSCGNRTVWNGARCTAGCGFPPEALKPSSQPQPASLPPRQKELF